eukprot:g1233.t1
MKTLNTCSLLYLLLILPITPIFCGTRYLLQEDDALRLARLAAEGPLSELRVLIESGVDPDLAYNDTPPLWRAAARNRLQVVRYLVDEGGATLDSRNRNGTTALYIAAQRGLTEIVSFLLERGADPNIESNWGSTSLSVAIDNDYESISSNLIQAGAVVEVEKAASGQSILWTAAFQGNEEIVQLLLQRGVSVDQTDSTGVTPLYAAVSSNQVEIVELLLDWTANPNHQKNDGNTPLHSASANCFVDSIELLLAMNASRVILNNDGLTPLEVTCLLENEDSALRVKVEDLLFPLISAARDNNSTAVDRWLFSGEDMDLQLRSGKTALMCAVINNNREIITSLLDAGATVSLMDISGWTALHFAGYNNSASAVRLIGGNLSDPNLLNADSMTPLMLAVSQRSPDLATVEALLEIESDPNFQSENGDTAFHIAARFANAEVLSLLRNAGANWTIQNNQGDRPVDVVSEEQEDVTEEEILQLLQLMQRSSERRTNSEQEFSLSTSNSETESDDSFSTGETLAFLLVPAFLLVLCVSALILHFRARDIQKAKKVKDVKTTQRSAPVLSTEQNQNTGKALRAIKHFARQTEREITVPAPGTPPELSVSLQSYGVGDQMSMYLEPKKSSKRDFSTAQRVGEWVGSSTATAHGASSFTRAPPESEITPEEEPAVPFRPRQSPTIFKTKSGVREKPKPVSMSTDDEEFNEFYDAKEKLTGSVIMSSTQSEEFKDAIEQQSSLSFSSRRASTGAEEYLSASGEPPTGDSTSSGQTYASPAGRMPATDLPMGQSVDSLSGVNPPDQGDLGGLVPSPPPTELPSFPVGRLSDTMSSASLRGSSITATQELVEGGDERVPVVVQQAPREIPEQLTSFAVGTFSDTSSIASRRQSRDELSTTGQTVISSPSLSIEIQQQSVGDVQRISATDQTTEQSSRVVEAFALSTFGSTGTSVSRRVSTDSRGLSFEQAPEPPEGGESTPAATGDVNPELTPHPVSLLRSSFSSMESSEPRSDLEGFQGFQPPSNTKNT